MKSALAAAALLALVCSACTRGEATNPCGPKPRVVVLSAFDRELAPLVAATKDGHMVTHDGAEYLCGVLGGREVVLSVTGIGPQHATSSTEHALSMFSASAVVVVGVAGGIGEDLHIADVTVPERWSRHDEETRWITADAALIAAAHASKTPALTACQEPRLCARSPSVHVGGNAVTGKEFVADPAAARDLATRLSARVTDMETASIAAVAEVRHVPFIAIRAVSDVVQTGQSEELVESYHGVAADNAAATAIALLQATGSERRSAP